MKALLTILLTGTTAFVHAASTVPEPETIFYGKVINRSGPQDHQMTEGSLEWSVDAGGSEPMVFMASLQSLADGSYSYRLAIPHSALALDLEAATDGIPLKATEDSYEHLQIAVNGFEAVIAEPGSYTFDVGQATRASTYRLDLDVSFALPDSDGDGMADWWEDKYGFDKQVNDGSGDLDGDGRSNLAEYLAGTDPNSDGRVPELVTSEVSVSAAGTSGVYLKTLDEDSTSVSLTYTLTEIPAEGSLRLRDGKADPSKPDELLVVGSTFSQADINAGRLIHVAAEEPTSAIPSFAVSVSDGDPEHASAVGEIELRRYQPDTTAFEALSDLERTQMALSAGLLEGVALEDDFQVRRHILARDGGFIVWNLEKVSRPISLETPMRSVEPGALPLDPSGAIPVWISGGSGADELSGGEAADALVGGTGDDLLRGGPGADRFIFTRAGFGTDTVLDFSQTEGDMLDVSRLLQGESTLLSDYVSVAALEDDVMIRFDVDGDGSGFSDREVILKSVASADLTLRSLWNGGHLLTDGLSLPPLLNVVASELHGSENGPTPTSFTITLDAPLSAPLVVNLNISGVAGNGVDYEQIPSQITLPVGVLSFDIPVRPYSDSLAEPGEVVALALSPGDGYELASTASAQVIIDDLMAEISISVLEPVATKDTGSKAFFLIQRTGIVDRSVLVRLELGGTATGGSDYKSIDSFLYLASGETSAVIAVEPLAGGTLQGGTESVRLGVKADAAYRSGDPEVSQVFIVDSAISFADWVAGGSQEVAAGNLAAFAKEAAAMSGISNILLYAFGAEPDQSDMRGVLPQVKIVDGHLGIEFTRLPAARDVRYIVETAENLAEWSADGSKIEDVSHTLSSNDARRALFRVTEPMTASGRGFLRVRVIYQP